MATPTDLPIETPYQTIDEAIQSFTAMEQQLRSRYDRRAIFVTGYLRITQAIKQSLDAQLFQDNAWVTRYAVCFANYYRLALLAFERRDHATLPKAWRIAFETSQRGGALVIQDLILGVNAHINYDLALALVEVGIDPQRATRYADHTRVNDVLRAAVDTMQEQISRLYAPILRLLDHAYQRLDEEIACFSVAKARESAWVSAVALANARDDSERRALGASLNDRSAVLARLILAPTVVHPWIVGALQHLETLTPWTQMLPPAGPS